MYLLALLAFVAATADAQAAQEPRQEVTASCLACHGDSSLSTTLASGETLSLHVEPKTFGASVHGQKLSCLDCHPGMDEVPHAQRAFSTKRQASLAHYEQCKRCHYSTFAKTLDSAHQSALTRGDVTAPLCVDCHGAHDIVTPNRPRGRVRRPVRNAMGACRAPTRRACMGGPC